MSRLRTAIRIVLGSLMFAAVSINLANIVGRYAFSKPVFWAEEAMVFLQVWCVLIGAALVSYENAHLRMDAFEHPAPRPIKRGFNNFTGILMLAVSCTLAWVSVRVVIGMMNGDQRSIALEIPMAVPYAALPIGFSIVALVAVLRLVNVLRGRDIAAALSQDDAQQPPA